MRMTILTAILGLTLLAGCSRGAETKDGLTAKQNADLDNAAAMLGDQEIDTSPDSLVPDEGNGVADAGPRGNSNVPAPPRTVPGNAAAPRR